MAYRVVIFMVLLAMLWDGTTAQSSSCTSALTGLYPCLNYVSGNSSTPSTSCCSQLTSVVKSNPECLCLLLNGTASSYGININQTLALALPDACKVQTPPVSKCNAAANEPTAASPESPPSSSSRPSNSNLPSGSKTVPSTNGNNVGGSSIIAPSVALSLVLFTASYVLSMAGI